MSRVVFIGYKARDRGFAVTETMRQCFSLGVLTGTLGEITTKGGSKIYTDLSQSDRSDGAAPDGEDRR
jgi:hypothetical protein